MKFSATALFIIVACTTYISATPLPKAAPQDDPIFDTIFETEQALRGTIKGVGGAVTAVGDAIKNTSIPVVSPVVGGLVGTVGGVVSVVGGIV